MLARIDNNLLYDPDTGEIRWKNLRRGYERFNGQIAGTLDQQGYRSIVIRNENGRQVHLRGHKIAWYLHFNTYPMFDIDHANRNRQDNRLGAVVNLRRSTPLIEKLNRSLLPTNKSGVRGVSLCKDGRYRAEIMYDRQAHFLGRFKTLAEAAAARRAAEIAWFGQRCPVYRKPIRKAEIITKLAA